ncbi:Crp/Fnr family transcriptional regulator [Limobrevibacterium gyesilva]|uniref:Crp/Fnr family transcriptional regulator n=1 Tax=Limobrevibacterium gyesilva TaxID=2991712 RepID=A0AA41YNZ5_9PROT|nr:Crp/Fnr family transcriptional regulator [Limobrevibacterium gyesilva]MCW3473845.1 Crp/Fnr family transcriptional regulator [Limobrevibacterium gyesilva]
MLIALPRSENCGSCGARRLGFCGALPSAEVDALAMIKHAARDYPAGAELYRQGERSRNYFIVISGWVMQYTSLDSGEQHVRDFALPGEMIGFKGGADQIMRHSAQCLTASRICALPADRIREHMARSLPFAARMVDMLAGRETRANDHAVNIGARSARDRVSHFLVELFQRVHHRLPQRPGDAVSLPLTLTHIGLALGLTHVHVSRTLRSLREQNVLQFSRHRLEVLDPAALGHIVGFDLSGPEARERQAHATSGAGLP